jgi:hypothetical protein
MYGLIYSVSGVFSSTKGLNFQIYIQDIILSDNWRSELPVGWLNLQNFDELCVTCLSGVMRVQTERSERVLLTESKPNVHSA